MHEDVASLLRSSADEVVVPDGALTEVLRDGRRRKNVRRVLGSGAALVLITGAWTGWAYLTPLQKDASNQGPAATSEAPDVDRPLIVVPAPEGAGPAGTPEAVADARAVTFSFHTLLRTVGYERYDYKNFDRAGQRWLVWFDDGPTVEDFKELLISRRHHLEEYARYRDDDRERLVQLRLDLEDAGNDQSEIERVTERIQAAEQSFRSWTEELQETSAELEDASKELQEVREVGTPRVELTVAREGEWMVVEDVSGPFSENDELSIRAYRERAEDVDVHGTDWYNVRLVGPGVVDDISGVEAFGFTTTPIPSSYREECLVILRDESGTVVYRQRDIHDTAQGAPLSEDRRDGWMRSSGIEYEQISEPYERLVPDFECHEGNG